MKTLMTMSLFFALFVFVSNAAAECFGIETENTPLPCETSPDNDGDGIPYETVVFYNDGIVCLTAWFYDLPSGIQPLAPFAGVYGGLCSGPRVYITGGCHPFLPEACGPHRAATNGTGAEVVAQRSGAASCGHRGRLKGVGFCDGEQQRWTSERCEAGVSGRAGLWRKRSGQSGLHPVLAQKEMRCRFRCRLRLPIGSV